MNEVYTHFHLSLHVTFKSHSSKKFKSVIPQKVTGMSKPFPNKRGFHKSSLEMMTILPLMVSGNE